MNRKWLKIGLISAVGLLGIGAYAVSSIAYSIEYDVVSYQIQYLDATGVTFRIVYAVNNPTRYNLEVWNQKYEVLISGYKISEVTAVNRYKLLANNTSIIQVDMRINWVDVQTKLASLYSQSSITDLKDLPVLIKGNLSAKMGILKLAWIPVRTTLPLSYFLP
jgi:hypothetical protein